MRRHCLESTGEGMGLYPEREPIMIHDIRREMEMLSSPVVRSMASAIPPAGMQSQFSHLLVNANSGK